VLATCFPNAATWLLALLVCVLIPSSLIGIHIHENPRLSPIDEITQYDYVNRLAAGSFPRLGQSLLPSTLHVLSCRGSAFPEGSTPPCPGTANPRQYPGGGYQYEAQQPPTYYAATVPVRWLGVQLFGLDEVTAARAGGALWVSFGLLLLWMAGGILGVSRRKMVPAILLLAGAPVVIYQSSIVSNDAPALFAGGLVLFLGALAWTRPARWLAPVLALAGFVVTSIKLDDALAPLAVSVVLALATWTRLGSSDGWRHRLQASLARWAPHGGALLAGAVLSALAWIIINRHLNLINPKTLPTFDILRMKPIRFSDIAREALTMLNPLGASFDPWRTNTIGRPLASVLSRNLQTITSTLTQFLLIAGGLAGLFVHPRRWPHWLGLTSLATLYLGGIVLGVGVWRTYNANPSLSGRYGLAVAPLLVLALVAGLRGRAAVIGVWAFSLATCALAYFYLFST
jgi:hypothetical protein